MVNAGSTKRIWAACLLGAVLCFVLPNDASAALFGKKKKTEPASETSAPPLETAPGPLAPSLPPDAAAGRIAELESEITRQQEQIKQLETDRDNVLAQTRILLGEKSRFEESTETLERQAKELEAAKGRVDSLTAEKQNLEQQVSSTVASYDDLQRAHKEMQGKSETLAVENEQLSLALFERLENDPQVRRMMDDLKAEREKTRALTDKSNKIESEIKKTTDEMRRSAQRESKLSEELASVKSSLKLIEAERNNLLDTVREQEDSLGRAPDRFKGLAQENRMLIKETSEMHYNMGVFFSDKKQYDQAISEYERALEFDPTNGKVHYNLGYLYSEGFKNHEQAIYHFREYMKIEPQSPFLEQLRSYILARETQARDLNSNKWEENLSRPFKKKGERKPPDQ